MNRLYSKLEYKDIEILKKSLQAIMEVIINYNDELKRGEYRNVRLKVKKIFKTYYNFFSSNFTIIESPNFGINIQIIGMTSKILFPYVLFFNNFRIQIIKNLENYLKNSFNYQDLLLLISKELIKTTDSKRGGFNNETLELLRFYFQNFNYVLDNSFSKFEPYYNNYNHKYSKISKVLIEKRFDITQKYTRLNFIPNNEKQKLNAILMDYSNFNNDLKTLQCKELGLIYDDQFQKKFFIGFISNKQAKEVKQRLIRNISFFENLDLYYKNKKFPICRNRVKDIFKLYCDYKDKVFSNTAIDFNSNFLYNMKKINDKELDIESLIHIFNTRRLPLDFEIHPILNNHFHYRLKLLTIYSTVHYLIHIYDPRNKKLDHYWQLLDVILKNTFANGYIIHYKTGLLLSTRAFKEDFERVKKEFQEFIWSFKLECKIYENLHYIPFSFYHLPNSFYYSNETQEWTFPLFEDKPVQEYFDHLAVNYRQEMKRLEKGKFKARVNDTVDKLTGEIAEIKKKRELKKKNV